MKKELIIKKIKEKIITYLKYKNYSKAKLKEKLLLLKYKYPQNTYYKKFKEEYIDQILNDFEKYKIIDENTAIPETIKNYKRKNKSLKEIEQILIYKQLYNANLVKKYLSREKEEINDKIIRTITNKINNYKKKNLDKKIILYKIQNYLYKKAFTQENINKILQKIKNRGLI